MIIEVKDLNIATDNGYSISSQQFLPENSNDKTIVISSATGVLQKFYSRFATYFAEYGFTVYTFDYYGIGKSDSNPSRLKHNNCNLKSWGKNDQAAVVAFAKKQNIRAELILITHSIGGQITGFNPNYNFIDKIVMVASQSGYWKYFNGIHFAKMWLFWHVIIPIITPIFGYFPSKKLGLFENLPKNMVYEWAKWGKQKNYLMHFYTDEEYYFNNIEVPVLSLSFSGDNFAPIKTVDWLAQQYKNAKTERVHFTKPINSAMLKHFGFFKQKFKDPIWSMTMDWILTGKKPHE
ncbi:alpha/beta hydrolase [Aurantibacter sp.]|uniref:alpha/beta hydrolase family protein n=1 Tax=Aurantibacter sp. TaxID=2807103 RepID=UPI003265D76B